ncbi:sulfite exporter TauE/SafE family protein [Aeoliella sp. ICT_H6.2]|uniref:Probable membrane transporter protein n=1 Tax=Aeoliella straminimaris TaxID=2954799 RepID=A0A9X2F5Z0_9BACT|nr:sulfite exporter TauE/SafE family protein [Aeoliella straminimaris]MCO6042318.1 sulfite exporter TauE/SafE family protein [Aeoliella straminimaris]
MPGIAIVGGIAIGFALGLTGGGGGIFAVPLLVYGLKLPAREAVGVSLAAVGTTALLGALGRLHQGQADLRTGLIFALAGMIGAPLGSRLSALLPESMLLVLFSGLMLVVAVRMWNASRRNLANAQFVCQRDESGRPTLGPRCIALLSALGLSTGVLSGMFGVGGGFVIVPALVLLGGLSIHVAVATSLLVIFLISISGVTSYVLGGGSISWALTGLFTLGGVVGMQFGSRLSARVSGPVLQRVFAAAMVAVACFVVVKSLA